MRVLIIIPAYNEQESIEGVVKSICTECPQYDYLIVNDCSTDRTREICEQKGFPHVNLPLNLGIGGGVQTGYRYAVANGYDVAVQLDGDGQHDPKYIDALIEQLNNGADMAVGSRFINKDGFQTSAMRRFGIGFLSAIIKLCTGKKVYDVTSGFRATNRELTRFYSEHYAQDYPEPEAIMVAILGGFNVVETPVVMRERQGGKSSIRALRSCYYMIKVTLSLLINRIAAKREKRR